jgi:hypothetical protein
MAQFEADKMINLLQFCCWKARCSMDHSGFQELAGKIDSFSERTQLTPNDRYFIDLLSDSRVAAQKDNLIGRRQAYIDLLLRFGGFDNWRHWKESFYAASEYLDAEAVDTTQFPAMETAICFPVNLDKQLLPDLSFVQKSADYPVRTIPCKEDSALENLKSALSELDSFPFIIWAIPTSWKDQLLTLKEPGWEDMLSSRRVVPVWIEEQNAWERLPPAIPWLKHQQTIGGLPGILACLLFMREAVQKYRPATENSKAATSGKVQNLRHNRGTFFLGDVQIKGEHLAMGDIHQTIHNHKNNEYER